MFEVENILWCKYIADRGMAQDSYTWVKKYIYKLVSFVVYLIMSNINICKNRVEFTQICWTMNIYSICKLCMLCIYIYINGV